jgi:hypothetical protein
MQGISPIQRFFRRIRLENICEFSYLRDNSLSGRAGNFFARAGNLFHVLERAGNWARNRFSSPDAPNESKGLSLVDEKKQGLPPTDMRLAHSDGAHALAPFEPENRPPGSAPPNRRAERAHFDRDRLIKSPLTGMIQVVAIRPTASQSRTGV